MTTIEITTLMKAPIAKCFDLSLNIDLEKEAGKGHQLQPIGGRTSGIIGSGERVRWKAKQYGFWVTHTSEITAFDAPVFFQDSMVQGIFRSFQHNHYFRALDPEKTEMRDMLSFSMPLFALGTLSERLIVRRRLFELLTARNRLIQQAAEKSRIL
jgi:ligand-binding SRPBCC domain-containing protein